MNPPKATHTVKDTAKSIHLTATSMQHTDGPSFSKAIANLRGNHGIHSR
jgi:hypothetical protein